MRRLCLEVCIPTRLKHTGAVSERIPQKVPVEQMTSTCLDDIWTDCRHNAGHDLHLPTATRPCDTSFSLVRVRVMFDATITRTYATLVLRSHSSQPRSARNLIGSRALCSATEYQYGLRARNNGRLTIHASPFSLLDSHGCSSSVLTLRRRPPPRPSARLGAVQIGWRVGVTSAAPFGNSRDQPPQQVMNATTVQPLRTPSRSTTSRTAKLGMLHDKPANQ